MSIKDYMDTVAPAPGWLKAIQADARRRGLDKLRMHDIERLIAEIRAGRALKRSTGRSPK